MFVLRILFSESLEKFVFVKCCVGVVGMSSAQKDSLTASKSGLKPSILNDTSGPYIVS